MASSITNTRTMLSASDRTSQKQITKDLNQKINAFLESKKNANNLIDIISTFQNDDATVLLPYIKGIPRIFTQAIANQEMYFKIPPHNGEGTEDLTKQDRYKLWLRERYNCVVERLLELLHHSNSNVQELSLCTIMKFVKAEGHSPLKEFPEGQMCFPIHLLQPVVICLLSNRHNMCSVVKRFQEFLEYDDVRYFTMKFTMQDLKEKTDQDFTETYMNNLYTILENLSMPVKPLEENNILQTFISRLPANLEMSKVTSYKEQKKLFTALWLSFLKWKLSTSLYKKVLLMIHDKIIPHMTSPLLLSDFLTNSYDIGGAISLLALNGLFILVNKYNLNYPDFYEKLYALFEPSIFHVKYRARFFFLADLFLTSTHLPSYLVAAFAKRLSRLTLTAPPHCLTVILPFVYNLLIRHPSCQTLVNRSTPSELESDPFIMEETNLSKCKAMESSLWEIHTLQSHFHHAIATEAKSFSRKFKEREIDLSPLLETTFDDLLQKEVKKKVKDVPLTYNPKLSLCPGSDDIMSELWTIS